MFMHSKTDGFTFPGIMLEPGSTSGNRISFNPVLGPELKIIKSLFIQVIVRATKEDISRDYKTKLQEEVQNRFKLSPQYKLAGEIGPDHDKTFEVHLFISGNKVGEGIGKSKKQAEQNAAHNALNTFDDFAAES